MNVLSLFDGISCGQLVLKSLGIKVEKYFSSEIDYDAIKSAMKSFPATIQLGDVRYVRARDLPKIDLLIGGSPCQGFSIARGGLLNFDHPESKLFFEYHRIFLELKKLNPKIKFLLENVWMRPEYEKIISNLMGVESLKINSELFCAQARRRLYWTNIPIDTLPTKLHRETIQDIVHIKPLEFSEHTSKLRYRTDSRAWKQVKRVMPTEKKYPTIMTHNNPLVYVDFKTCRYLTCNEMEKLQGLPIDYTKPTGSKRNRERAIGNGWQIDTIKFLFKNLKQKQS